MKLIRLMPVLFVITMIYGCTGNLWIDKDVKKMQPQIDKVLILFPHIEYYVKDDDRKISNNMKGVVISKNISSVLKDIIEKGKFVAKAVVVENDTDFVNQWIAVNYLHSLKHYKKIDKLITISKVGKKIFPMTPELKLLLDKTDADYFIFINGTSFGTTDNSKSNDIIQARTFAILYNHSFAYEYQWDGLQLQIFLVEKKSNEIVWSNQSDSKRSKYNPFIKDEIRELCVSLFEQK